jgi:hypothetical protein
MNAQARPWLLVAMARLFVAQARLYCWSALMAGLLGIVSLTAVSIFMVRGTGEGEPDPRALWQSMTFAHQLIAIFGIVFALWTPILLAARGVCRITTEQLSGRPISLQQVVIDMLRFLPAALVYSLVIGFPTMIGSTIFFIPGMVIASLFALVVPAGTNEPGGVFTTLRRGVSLGGKVFGKSLLVTLASGALLLLIVALRIVFLDRLLPGSVKALFPIRFAIAYVPGLLVLVLANIAFTLLYGQARAAETPLVRDGPAPLQP